MKGWKYIGESEKGQLYAKQNIETRNNGKQYLEKQFQIIKDGKRVGEIESEIIEVSQVVVIPSATDWEENCI